MSDKTLVTNEIIDKISTGVIKKDGVWNCLQCHTKQSHHFYKYNSPFLNKEIVYCRHCINLGRMDNINLIFFVKSKNVISQGIYHLDFQLSEQQAFASSIIVQAIKAYECKILYAVTGAGKTEMVFEGIQYARSHGYNIAIVSPRVDVVIEISIRIKKAFSFEQIDVLYQGQMQRFDGHFVIATVHQLYRFKRHFDLIIVDEVDAFPLTMDLSLQAAVKHASKVRHAHIFMTATPPRHLLKTMNESDIITLPARFHRHPLPVPRFKYFKLKQHKQQYTLLNILNRQIEAGRYTLVFFDNIDLMKAVYLNYKKEINALTYVHSEDALRFEKINDLRKGTYSVVFTTTILERGFTMSNLDVIVCNSQLFNMSALIQMAGRVGRMKSDPTGLVLFLHEGITLNMLKARKHILKMNRLAIEKRWIDG
ncbi:DNA/RNA helicase [Staphylococcus edaphicus]|uniref:DNA/RNA helicase n=1 Tax=Staphylococcus edaphicus TaxID=1955013 RepID=A0A2C6WMM1_9STAP|nr:DNA/RNA helicase [Staphylococcus edaphicus]